MQDGRATPHPGLFTSGGISTVTGTATTVSFASQAPSPAETIPGSDTIAWGAAASAMLGAFLAEVQRRKDEEARAAAEAFEQRLKKAGKWKQAQRDNPLTYNQIAKAYQAAMNNFKAALNAATTSGMSAAQAEQLKQQVAQTGKIEGALGAVTAFVEKKAGQKVEAAPAPQQVSPPPAPEGISPEAQQAFLHGGAAAQNWIAGNAAQLQQSYVEQQAAAQERARKEMAQAADAARWTGLAAMEQAKIDAEAESTWWERSLEWADENQTLIAVGTGLAVGLTAVALGSVCKI